jgi:hypothetical protein
MSNKKHQLSKNSNHESVISSESPKTPDTSPKKKSPKTKPTDSKILSSPVKDDAKIEKNDDRVPVKISMKSIRMVAEWSYTSENSECLLCHKDLMMPVQEPGSNKLNGDVNIGTCQHGFHSVCINDWISHQNVSCPQCQTIWKTIKNVGSFVYVYKST